MTSKLIPLFLLLAGLTARAADSAGAAPAAITREGDLVVLVLQPAAEERLRLQTVAVEKRRVPSARLFSGEIIVPLTAPGQVVGPMLGGTLDEVLRLADLQAAADGRILQAQVQVTAARIAVERAEKVLDAQAGSVRSVDEARAALSLAEASLTTARAQRDLLGTPVGQAGPRRLWVRVSIYSGEAARLDPAAPASLRPFAAAAALAVSPVAGPPTANALVNTVDWYFALPADATLRAGERVAVEIPEREADSEQLVVPFAAVLHDIHGGQWIYERTAEHRYTRRRVEVARLAGADAVLRRGPAPGARIVTAGAAELFGTEFMTGK